MKRYLAAHWQGDLSLVTSFWLNGVIGYVGLIALVVELRSYMPFYPGVLVCVVFLVWACVGIARSALRIVRSSQSTITRKFRAYLALVVVVVVGVGTLADLGLLLR